MRVSRLLSLSFTVIGGLAASRILQRRHDWEQRNRRVAICVDYDDAYAAAIRANMSFDDMLAKLAEHGATHLSLPELTLQRLQGTGEFASQVPRTPLCTPAPVGHWNYLHGRPELVDGVAQELATRLPHTEAHALDDTTLAFAGDLPTVGEIGLGFDEDMARRIARNGLAIVPRPVSYAWPEQALLDRTLAQAGELGDLVAFEGDMILGHEMHLDETLAGLEREGLTFVYFAESRHQKGDWFIAKQHAPHVILGHQFPPQDMMVLDIHAACHNWVHLARERGIRFCYVNFFRVLHATEPLEGLAYLAHLKRAMEEVGLQVAASARPPTPMPAHSTSDFALTSLASAGTAASATNTFLTLPEPLAIPLTLAAAGGAVALPWLDQARGRPNHSQDHDHHDHSHPAFPTSYAPKLLALTTASLTPIAANVQYASSQSKLSDWIESLTFQIAGAATLAALTTGPDYHLRIEAYRSVNLDWLLPLTTVALRLSKQPRLIGLAALAGAWGVAERRGLDLLAEIDPGHAEGHTHHISAAQRLIGDVLMALGPKPARKWTGLGPAGVAASLALARHHQCELAAGAALAGTVGNALGLVGFRRPERALAVTLRRALPSLTAGATIGLLLLLVSGLRGSQPTDRR